LELYFNDSMQTVYALGGGGGGGIQQRGRRLGRCSIYRHRRFAFDYHRQSTALTLLSSLYRSEADQCWPQLLSHPQFAFEDHLMKFIGSNVFCVVCICIIYLVIYLVWPHQFRRSRCSHKDLADISPWRSPSRLNVFFPMLFWNR